MGKDGKIVITKEEAKIPISERDKLWEEAIADLRGFNGRLCKKGVIMAWYEHCEMMEDEDTEMVELLKPTVGEWVILIESLGKRRGWMKVFSVWELIAKRYINVYRQEINEGLRGKNGTSNLEDNEGWHYLKAR